uniref:Copper transporter n=1 Tax=Leersia perrieri TaxID=77586 RepID=A0A0D9W4S0_9ORYZ
MRGMGMGDDGMGEPMAMTPPPRSGHAPPQQQKMAGMMMHMTFFWSDRAVVLFRGWPGERGAGMYALCLLFVLALAALTEGLAGGPVEGVFSEVYEVMITLLDCDAN